MFFFTLHFRLSIYKHFCLCCPFHTEHIVPMLPIFVVVLLSEVVVDWIKHAFITKFNDISPNVYRRYRAILSKDLATSRHENVSGMCL